MSCNSRWNMPPAISWTWIDFDSEVVGTMSSYWYTLNYLCHFFQSKTNHIPISQMRHESSRFQEMKQISRDEGVLPCFVSVDIPQQTKALQTRRFCSKNRFLRGESRLTWKRFVNPFTISHPIPCSCSIFYITVIVISYYFQYFECKEWRSHQFPLSRETFRIWRCLSLLFLPNGCQKKHNKHAKKWCLDPGHAGLLRASSSS